MKKDPYNHKEKFLKWKEKTKDRIEEISIQNSSLILRYLNDMERGINVGARKGARSYIRMNCLKQKLIFLAKKLEEIDNLSNITNISESRIFNFFSDMRNGKIKRIDGKIYKSVGDFVKIFRAFWHWWMKINRKQGKTIPNITIDLDTSGEKPKWVYLTEKEIKLLCDNAKYEYRVLIMFLFDSGMRSPTELMNIKVSDFYNNFKEVNIREEVSKTFGRRIKLLLCSELIKSYIQKKRLERDDFVFDIKPETVNQYFKRLGKKVLGDRKSPAGKKYSELTMYHFRHCSCCYWLPRYKSESALKYRFGWKKSERIHYYSEMLGMSDTISEEDILIDVTKTELENEQKNLQRENEILKDKIGNIENQMKQMVELMKKASIMVVPN